MTLPDTHHPKYRSEITAEFGNTGLNIDLGVGNRKHREDLIGLDIRDYPPVDILCDCTELIPLPTNSVSYCYSYHMLEHIEVGRQGGLYRELERVCSPDAKIEWWFPYWTHPTAYDISHVTILNEHTFTSYAFKARFVIEDIRYHYTPEFQNATADEKLFAQKHYFNAVTEMGLYFRLKT